MQLVYPPLPPAQRLGVSLGVAVFLGRPVVPPPPVSRPVCRESAMPGQDPGSSSINLYLCDLKKDRLVLVPLEAATGSNSRQACLVCGGADKSK
ncbi:hypothetical protein LY78DRAFT_458025 [Colletotrichum sublineola]|nr:hypothetical protein LY78DRAFT_458025 [Colletotrichum sublineola]